MPAARRLSVGGGLLVALTVAVSVLAYPEMPAEMATHWNASGDVDGTTSRTIALALFPAVVAADASVGYSYHRYRRTV